MYVCVDVSIRQSPRQQQKAVQRTKSSTQDQVPARSAPIQFIPIPRGQDAGVPRKFCSWGGCGFPR